MSLKKFFEQHLQLHTLRIELYSERVLRYQIDAQRKEELEEWMRNPIDPFSSLTSSFLSFYADYDRMVFIRISAIKRIIFCWDYAATLASPLGYSDPFDIIESRNIDTDVNEDTGTDETPEWLKGLDDDDGEASKEGGDVVNEDEPAEDDELLEDDELVKDDEFDNPDMPDIPDAIVLLHSEPQPLLYYDLDEDVDCLPVTNESGYNSLSVDGRFISFTDEDDEQNYIPVENIICLDVARRLVFCDIQWEEMERKRVMDNNTN